jgi:hypothetical protein
MTRDEVIKGLKARVRECEDHALTLEHDGLYSTARSRRGRLVLLREAIAALSALSDD